MSALIWAPVLLLPGELVIMAIGALQIAKEWRRPLRAAVAVLFASAIWVVRKYGLFGRLSELSAQRKV